MNQENNEIIKLLGDFSEMGLNTLSRYRERIESLEQENKHLLDLQKSMDKQYSKLEHNWNELKKYIKDYPSIRYSSIEKVDGIYLSGKLIREDNLLDKMQELEEGGNNENN